MDLPLEPRLSIGLQHVLVPPGYDDGEGPANGGDLPEVVRLLDALGYDSFWSGDHVAFAGPILDPLIQLAQAAALSDRLTVGTAAVADSEQDLRFRDIYFLNRFESDSEDRWFPTRNIDYKVKISGNGFANVSGEGYEQGLVTGAFLGAGHEHMGGTVKRTDMIGAFGGSR